MQQFSATNTLTPHISVVAKRKFVAQRDLALKAMDCFCAQQRLRLMSSIIGLTDNTHCYDPVEIETMYREERLGLGLNKADRVDGRVHVEYRRTA